MHELTEHEGIAHPVADRGDRSRQVPVKQPIRRRVALPNGQSRRRWILAGIRIPGFSFSDWECGSADSERTRNTLVGQYAGRIQGIGPRQFPPITWAGILRDRRQADSRVIGVGCRGRIGGSQGRPIELDPVI